MTLSQQLAEERRRRLRAERLLAQRQAELRAANRKLAERALSLSERVALSEAEARLRAGEAENLKAGYSRARDDLAAATRAAGEAETRLWQALQTVRDGFALFDAAHRLVIANRAYLSIFDGLDCVAPGVAYDDLAAILLDEGIVDPEGAPRVWLDAMRARWRQDPVPDITIKLWNGQFVKLVDRRTPDGGMVALGINTTDMMRMWAAMETIPDGFVMYDQDDRLVMCNQRYREIYPESAEAMIPGASFEDILRYGLARGQYAVEPGQEEAWLEERLTRHREAAGVLEQHLGDGRWLRIMEGPTPDGGRVGLRVDISSIKEQQAALERERERAEAANRAKSAFLANMSHEIRTPMNGVVGMAELLRGTPLDEEQRLYVETIKSSGQALLVILNDVLDYSKIEAERLELTAEPFDLEACIHDVALLLQPQAQDKGLQMIVDYDMFLPIDFIGDPGRIRQILINLVGNAVKFTQAGHVLIRVVGVEIPGPRPAWRIHIAIEDTGIGIPEDQQEHVFGKFSQVEDQRNRQFEGTGLGLAICRELVGLMGGDLWLDSAPGEGSCFGFALPLPLCTDHGRIPFRAPERFRRALVIEAPSAARAILVKQLLVLGLAVETVLPGTDISALAPGPADTIFVTQDACGDPPLACLERLRASGAAAVFLVSRGTLRDRGAARPPRGIFGYLPSPLRRSVLYDALHGLPQAPKTSPDPSAPAPAPPALPPPGPRLRVLAAEDNRTNRLVLERLLRDQPIELELVANGREALAAFTAARPDLVLMDISMPGMDGKEATRRIREAEVAQQMPRTPIVAMTAHALPGDAEEILAAGLDHYLTKPLTRAALLDCLRLARPEAPDGTAEAAAAPPEAAE